MSIVKYRGIALEIINTHQHKRQMVFTPDGVRYLYTRWTFDFDCRYNPRATSYRESVANVNVAPQPDYLPWVTDAVLRKYLAQPRGQLVITSNIPIGQGGGILLKSPGDTFMVTPQNQTMPGWGVDCQNGPIVEFCDVREVKGDKQFLVTLRITTCINECPIPGGTAGVYTILTNPMLSHQWQRKQTTDQDFFSAVVTQGEAIFRRDALQQIGTHPDTYRRSLGHPIPINHQREGIEVEETSDGCGVRYSFIDREKPFNFGALSEATRVEAYATVSNHQQSFVDASLNAIPGLVPRFADQLLSGVGSVVQNIGQGRWWSALASAGGVTARLGGFSAAVGLIAAIRSLPRFSVNVLARAWGHRDSTRSQLARIVEGIVMARIRPLMSTTKDMHMTVDLNGKFVEFGATMSWGFTTALGNQAIQAILGADALGFGNLPTTFENLTAGLSSSEDIIGINGVNFAIEKANTGNPMPPYSKGTRGTALVKLTAQALAAPCDPPGFPAAQTTGFDGVYDDLDIPV